MRYAVRVHGRGVVTRFNGEPITNLDQAQLVVTSVEALGESASVETLLLDITVEDLRAADGHTEASARE